MTHSDITFEDQKGMGITPQMIRLSIGVEAPQDLMLDLGQAFKAVEIPKEVEVAELA